MIRYLLTYPLTRAVTLMLLLAVLFWTLGCSDIPDYRRPSTGRLHTPDTVLVCDKWAGVENCKHVARGDLEGYFGQ
jgi:hypothetical protein